MVADDKYIMNLKNLTQLIAPKENVDFKPLTLDDIIQKNYEPKRFNGIWLNSKQMFI